MALEWVEIGRLNPRFVPRRLETGGVCFAARRYMTPTLYDAGLYNRSRNRARNWVHSRIWPSRDYFLSTPSTRKTTIASLLSLMPYTH